ncbi:hypothetical protein C8J56DRAFT_934777 [Mycena floridula]|nr:hypothetical protein C8J56DRAFT_934777 [Mycena floridula]
MSHLNLEFFVDAIGKNLDGHSPGPVPRRRVRSSPILPERLPSSAFLEREAQTLAPDAILKQMKRRSQSPESPSDVRPNHTRSASSSPTTSTFKGFMKSRANSTRKTGDWKEPQPFEILRAVEEKDIMFLMEVRDRSFKLLLQKTGDTTPLLHAMRIQSHQEVAIVLLGAFSRWINQLEDSDMKLPETRPLLKALRTNLKMAIDFGLAQSQSDLTASFLQTLIMSQGDKWIMDLVESLSLELRAPDGKPVKTAGAAVWKFATRELGKAELIASLEDYVANATSDLLMMAVWSLTATKLQFDQISPDPIPPWYFARDDRVHKAFQERIYKYHVLTRNSIGRRLKWQIEVLSKVLEGRTTTYRNKVESLASQLDGGQGS